MRKRLEARDEQRRQERAVMNEQHKRRHERQGSEAPLSGGDTPCGSADDTPRQRVQPASPGRGGAPPPWSAVAAAAAEAEERGVRLPPLDGDERRGRRCMSQPPVESEESGQRSKKPGRPRSMGPKDKEEEGDKCTRQMFDKYTLRLREKEMFSKVI